jgi:uncharacterized iron-regulated protein
MAPAPAPAFVVVAPATGHAVPFSEMAARVAAADIVLVGEQHDDPETHRAELALLDAVGHSGRGVVLSLEMFERDVQGAVDDYLAGRTSESEFLQRSRPWARYASDYRGLVQLAKDRGWRVVAANVPRPLASAIGRGGMAVLDTLPPGDRAMAAREIVCPNDDYRRRFLDEMKGHGSGGAAPAAGDTLPTATAERFYVAQCVKDETMAESSVSASASAAPGTVVVDFDGAFHSDVGEGTAVRVRRRAPAAKVVIVTAVPVADPVAADVTPHASRADWIIFTRKPAPKTPPGS